MRAADSRSCCVWEKFLQQADCAAPSPPHAATDLDAIEGENVSHQTRIIPIAAGKGGVGKTFLAANLSIALAEAGHSVTAVDLDLGGSNLHCHLGVSNCHAGLGDFLKAHSVEFSELPVRTDVEGLRLISGDGKSPFMANIAYTQKRRLIKHLQQLDSDYVVLDLGAGSSFNTLDFFALSNHGLMVTQPEYPALINLLTFIKHFLLRRIEREFHDHREVREFMQAVYKRPMDDNETSIPALRRQIAAIDRNAGRSVAEIARRYRPRIIFNMGYSPDEMAFAKQIEAAAHEFLCVGLDFFGFIFHDKSVHASVSKRQPFLLGNRDSIAAVGIQRIARRISTFWDRPMSNSAMRIQADARRLRTTFEKVPRKDRPATGPAPPHAYL